MKLNQNSPSVSTFRGGNLQSLELITNDYAYRTTGKS